MVFRATDPALLDMVQGMLEAEGLQPVRLGRANPALMGGGDSAFEQLISVPRRHEQTARALIDGARGPRDEEALERQALAATPEPGVSASEHGVAGATEGPRALYAIAVAALLAIGLWIILR